MSTIWKRSLVFFHVATVFWKSWNCMKHIKLINNSELCAFDILNFLLQTCEQLQAVIWHRKHVKAFTCPLSLYVISHFVKGVELATIWSWVHKLLYALDYQLPDAVITELQRWPRELCSLYNRPLCSAGSAATSTCASVPLSPTRDPSAHTGTSVASGPGHENPTYLHWKTKHLTRQQNLV